MYTKEFFESMRGQRILVVGDMIADVYLTGRISRISREAPVLVLEHAGERIVAGGAANVVNNLAALGADAAMIGVIGNDAAGAGLVEILRKSGVRTKGVIVDAARPTNSKTRIIAGGRETVSQQIVRVDHEDKSPLSKEIEEKLIENFHEQKDSLSGVVISDYGGAVISDGLAEKLLLECNKSGIRTVVDSRYSIRRFRGVSFVKQNDSELSAAMGTKLKTEQEIRGAGEELRRELAAEGVLITRGEKGMTLVMESGATDIPVTDKSEVYDVSGAGDTCVAAFILAMAAGAAPSSAAFLSNAASGIAVRKLGTATVSAEELWRIVHKGAVG